MLWSGNGRMIARNAVPYESRKHVLQAVKLIRPNVNEVRLVVKGTEE
jgi:pyridoxal/pyridoxine/pyridoxamine kinase